MSPVQHSEDPARNLRGIWLGPTGAWRWPFDATFTEWGIGVFASVLAWLVLTFALPLGVLLVIVALAGGRWVAASQPEDSWARLLHARAGRRRARRLFTGAAIAFWIIWFPSPLMWLLPMHWWAAGPAAIYVAVRCVKRIRPWVDGNRPVSYWAKTLPLIASGPRPVRAPMELTPAIETAEAESGLDWPTLDFLSAVAAFDLEGMVVLEYREKTEPVEATLFDSRSGDPRTREGVVAWLQAAGAQIRTHVHQTPEGRILKVDVDVNGERLKENHVIVLKRSDGTFRQYKRTQFALQFEAIATIEEVSNVRA